MADPKYAGLPGIVVDQPDLYETSDLPESDQEYNDPDTGDMSPSVEVLHISTIDAHEKFKGKVLDATSVDFSDRLSRKPRNGYSNRRVEWEIAGEGDDETIVQKYQRLQCEVNHLLQEVQELKQGDVPCADGKVSAVQLAGQVKSLQNLLLQLKLEESLGTDIVAFLKEPQAAQHKRLLHLLESFKNATPSSNKEAAATEGKEGKSLDGITYELFYTPEHARLNQLAKAAQLEKRLDKVEALVGKNPEKLSSLSTWTNHKSLLSATQVLSSRLALLEPANLDHIEGRLHAVHSRMNAISEKKTAVEDAEKQSKVSELYDLVQKCETLAPAVPEVVDRLVCVESLHQEASQFSRSLKQLDVAQTELSTLLQSNGMHLSEVQDKFSQNLGVINTNLSSLNKRIEKLQATKK